MMDESGHEKMERVVSQSDKKKNISLTQQIVSSATGALIVSTLMTPLDVVKTRLQSQQIQKQKCFLYSNGLMDHPVYINGNKLVQCRTSSNIGGGGNSTTAVLHTPNEACNCHWYERPKYFNGTKDAFIKITRTEGLSALWSGLTPTLILALPTTVIYFSSFEYLKSMLHNWSVEYSTSNSAEIRETLIPMISGGLSRIWAVSVVSPLELVRTKMQSEKTTLSQIRAALQSSIKAEGVGGLWKGYAATLLRDVPFSAIYWGVYESLKRFLNSKSKMESQLSISFVSGAVAGTMASASTLPMDVIKTRKQIELGQHDVLHLKEGRSRSVLNIGRDILKKDGVRGLFSGLTPRIVKVAPACAIMISSYEWCRTYFITKNSIHS